MPVVVCAYESLCQSQLPAKSLHPAYLLVFFVGLLGDQFGLSELRLQDRDPVLLGVRAAFQSLPLAASAGWPLVKSDTRHTTGRGWGAMAKVIEKRGQHTRKGLVWERYFVGIDQLLIPKSEMIYGSENIKREQLNQAKSK